MTAHVSAQWALRGRLEAGVAAALAHAARKGLRKFQFADPASRVIWLIDSGDEVLVSATSVPFENLQGGPAQAASHFEAAGFQVLAVAEAELERVAIERAERSARLLTLTTNRKISYDVVHVHQPVFAGGERELAQMAAGRPVMFVVDENVDRLHGDAIETYAQGFLNHAGKITIEAVELQKTVPSVARICKYAARLGFPRHGIFVAVGGGITLDVTGLAASAYRRGIGYLRIPTTLVGLIDAGLGVKQGVNFAGKKNLVGAFYPPLGVISDSRFLATLPQREIACGMAEIVKIALMRDRVLFELLERNGELLTQTNLSAPVEVARDVLYRSARLMLDELQSNLFESNLRRCLDFGHTFSPLIEARSGYEIPHGFAVAMDMLLSTAIAVVKGVCPNEVLARLIDVHRDVHLPLALARGTVELAGSALWAARQHRGGALNLAIPAGIGACEFVQKVSQAEIEQAARLIGEATAPSAGLRQLYAGAGI